MIVSVMLVGLAVGLAVLGITLALRSRLDATWEGRCLQCQEMLCLPLRVCHLCGADFGAEEYRAVIEWGRQQHERKKRGLLRGSHILLALAGLMLCVGLLIASLW